MPGRAPDAVVRAAALTSLALVGAAGAFLACGPSAREGETRPLVREGRAGIVTLEGAEVFSDGEWRKHGEFVFRDDRGEEIGRGRYVKGREEGPWTQRFEDGSYGEGEFSDGTRVGEWRYFHRNEALQDVGRYDRGFRTGTWRSFRSDGTKLRVAEYLEGELHGQVTWYLPDGETIDRSKSGEYRKGERR